MIGNCFWEVGEDGARGLKTSAKYPRFRMGSGYRIREKGPAGGEDGEEERGGTSRSAPLPRAWADFGHTCAKARAALLDA
jgi:hypothetical protein